MKIRVFLRFKAELSYDSFKMNQQEKEKESYFLWVRIIKFENFFSKSTQEILTIEFNGKEFIIF